MWGKTGTLAALQMPGQEWLWDPDSVPPLLTALGAEGHRIILQNRGLQGSDPLCSSARGLHESSSRTHTVPAWAVQGGLSTHLPGCSYTEEANPKPQTQ